jgi:hypothetical protein
MFFLSAINFYLKIVVIRLIHFALSLSITNSNFE